MRKRAQYVHAALQHAGRDHASALIDRRAGISLAGARTRGRSRCGKSKEPAAEYRNGDGDQTEDEVEAHQAAHLGERLAGSLPCA